MFDIALDAIIYAAVGYLTYFGLDRLKFELQRRGVLHDPAEEPEFPWRILVVPDPVSWPVAWASYKAGELRRFPAVPRVGDHVSFGPYDACMIARVNLRSVPEIEGETVVNTGYDACVLVHMPTLTHAEGEPST